MNEPADLPALRFAETARRLAAITHDLGLAVPAFRCPPKVAGADRTIRRYPGGAVVSVRLRGRAFEGAVADMVEGVLVANRVPTADAGELRAQLTGALAAAASSTDPRRDAAPHRAAA